jgi:DNA-binding NarL/FixJ family response regulator
MKYLYLLYAVAAVAVGLLSFGAVTLLVGKARKNARRLPSLEAICGKHNITAREQDVIRLIVQGHRNKEISEELCISVSTVKKYITSIYHKLDLKSRDELIALFSSPLENSSEPLSSSENLSER